MTIEDLNAAVASGEIDEIIAVTEARQRKALAAIADDIVARGGIRLVLLAGGSSSGKTTSSKRLATQLRVNGVKVMTLSTDDYFVGDKRNPVDENGEKDYESVECVDSVRLADDLNRLFAGEEINPRRFDFVQHEGYDAPDTVRLSSGGMVIVEGIHALNPRLSAAVEFPAYRIFIEPKTQLQVFATTSLPSTDARLVRRLVRDRQFRKVEPLETFRLWPKVLAGERKWILPFRDTADRQFDSALEYELAVLRPYVEGLLELVVRERPEETKAQILLDLIRAVTPTSPIKVPGDSILRETIGGSLLDY